MKTYSFAFKLLTVLISIAILLSGFNVAQAGGGDDQAQKTEGRRQFVAPDGQVLWLEEFAVVSSPVSKPLAYNCRSITHGIDAYNGVGVKVWRYAWKIDWCYDGSKIVSLNPRELVSIYAPGYSFKGNTRTVKGGVNQWNYYHLTRGNICYIDYGSNCAWHTYPNVEQDVNGKGGFYGNAW